MPQRTTGLPCTAAQPGTCLWMFYLDKTSRVALCVCESFSTKPKHTMLGFLSFTVHVMWNTSSEKDWKRIYRAPHWQIWSTALILLQSWNLATFPPTFDAPVLSWNDHVLCRLYLHFRTFTECSSFAAKLSAWYRADHADRAFRQDIFLVDSRQIFQREKRVARENLL